MNNKEWVEQVSKDLSYIQTRIQEHYFSIVNDYRRSKMVDAEFAKVVVKYSIICKCDNCGYEGQVELNKGEEVPKTIQCPNCECFTAHKYNPKVIKVDYNKPFMTEWIPCCPSPPIIINPPPEPLDPFKTYPIWCGIVIPENDSSIQKVYI